jgi:predicted HAD superfamily Cof-like phosphohydrolase
VRTFFQDVGEFHKKFDLPRYTVQGDPRMAGSAAPRILPDDELAFRTKFMVEELQEFRDACAAKDVAKAADALVDLVYVALGTAHMMHVPFDECWDTVQECNMQKERANSASDPRSTRKHRFDVVKPKGWKPPDLTKILSLRRG